MAETKRKSYLKAYWQSDKGKEVQKRYRQSKKGIVAIKRYQQSEKGKINHRRTNFREYTLHSQRIKARSAVNNAIKDGKLPRPDTLQCSCSEPAKHYHHHKGYEPEHWIDVIPICVKCHRMVEKKVA